MRIHVVDSVVAAHDDVVAGAAGLVRAPVRRTVADRDEPGALGGEYVLPLVRVAGARRTEAVARSAEVVRTVHREGVWAGEVGAAPASVLHGLRPGDRLRRAGGRPRDDPALATVHPTVHAEPMRALVAPHGAPGLRTVDAVDRKAIAEDDERALELHDVVAARPGPKHAAPERPRLGDGCDRHHQTERERGGEEPQPARAHAACLRASCTVAAAGDRCGPP